MASTFEVQLRRMETSQPWGFRLRGGTDQGMPLFVEHVQPKGRAAAQGIAAGDRIVAICGIPTHDKSHGEIKSEMLRAGNDLDLTVLRDGSMTAPGGPTAVPAEESRSQIDEEPIPKLGGPTYKQVKPKTYQVLEEQLQSSEDTSQAAAAEAGASKPSSIFDRKREERSDYLKAKGHTIQKAYGERP